VPVYAVWLGNVMILVGFWFIASVYRENTFTAATIEVAENQTVVTTGPYAIVRHPMYASSSLYVLGMPLALGSWWGFAGCSPSKACGPRRGLS